MPSLNRITLISRIDITARSFFVCSLSHNVLFASIHAHVYVVDLMHSPPFALPLNMRQTKAVWQILARIVV